MVIPGARPPINKAVENNPSIVDKAIDIQFQELIIEPFQLIGDSQVFPSVIIIDGLDECHDEDAQHRILHLIGNALYRRQLPFCFLIASRPEPRIQETFEEPIFSRLSRRLALDDSFHADDDIRTLLRTRFAAIHDKHYRTMKCVARPWPPDSTIAYLVRKALGQFIYASTVLKFIDDRYYRSTDRLETILGINTGHSTAFAELDQLYIQILSTSPKIKRTMHVLGAIIVLQRDKRDLHSSDFTSPELVESLLRLHPEDIYISLIGLGSLMENPDPATGRWKYKSGFHFFHASFPDFLVDFSRSGDFFINVQAVHADLCRSCLRILKEKPYSVQNTSRNVRENLATRYAMDNWVDHCRNSAYQKELLNDLKSFDLRKWVFSTLEHEEYSPPPLDALSRVISWLNTQGSPTLASRFAKIRDHVFTELISRSPNPDYLLVILCAIRTEIPFYYVWDSLDIDEATGRVLMEPVEPFLTHDSSRIRSGSFSDYLEAPGGYFIDPDTQASAVLYFLNHIIRMQDYTLRALYPAYWTRNSPYASTSHIVLRSLIEDHTLDLLLTCDAKSVLRIIEWLKVRIITGPGLCSSD